MSVSFFLFVVSSYDVTKCFSFFFVLCVQVVIFSLDFLLSLGIGVLTIISCLPFPEGPRGERKCKRDKVAGSAIWAVDVFFPPVAVSPCQWDGAAFEAFVDYVLLTKRLPDGRQGENL